MTGAGILRVGLGVFACLFSPGCEPVIAQSNPVATSIVNSHPELKTLLSDLDSESLETRNQATRQLGKYDISIIPVLSDVLMSGSPEQRTRVKRALIEMGSRNDASTLAKIRRVLFLLSRNGHPYLMNNDAKMQSAWQRTQSTNTIRELNRRQIDVVVIPAPARSVGVPLLDVHRSGFIIQDPIVKPVVDIPVDQGKSLHQIRVEISTIVGDDAITDAEAVREIKLKHPSHIPQPRHQVTIDESWNGDGDDLKLLQNLSGISGLSLLRTEISAEMFETLLRVNTNMVSIHNCEFDASDLKAFVRSRESTAIDIRPNAVLGVRGLTTNLAPTTGHSLDPCTISALIDGCPAREAGIQVGDTIVQIGENPMESFQDLIFDIAAREIGESVEIILQRDGETVVLTVILGDATGIDLR